MGSLPARRLLVLAIGWRPRRRAVSNGRHLGVALRFGWTLALVSGCAVVVHEEELGDEVLDAPISAIVAEVGGGDLTIEVGGTETVISRSVRWSGEEPRIDARLDADTLVLDVRCHWMQHVCSVDHHVVVPAPTALEVSLGSGDLTVGEVAGPLTVDIGSGATTIGEVEGDVTIDSGSGDVVIASVVGNLAVDSASGDVAVDALDAGSAVVDIGSGDVTLGFVVAPVRVEVDAGSGDVRLEVPVGRYAIHATTGSGELTLDGITADASADSVIRVDTGSGAMHILGR